MSLAYDPRRPEVLADPYPLLHHLQDEDPVHWSEILGGWVLTRYDDVKAALRDPRLSSDRITPFVDHYAKGGRGELGEGQSTTTSMARALVAGRLKRGP